MNARAVRTPVFKENESLADFVARHVPRLKEGSVIAIASKIAALSEGRTADISKKEHLIKKESTWRTRVFGAWWLTVRDGVAIVNAGIDESNADGNIILLPEDSYRTASRLRDALLKRYKIKTLGVVITDSRVAPLRAGVTGVALGYAGFKGVRDYRGTQDIFGRTMQVERTNIADSLATVATLIMGEGDERTPIAVIEDAPVEFTGRVNKKEVRIDPKQDMFKRLFRR